jgi:prepilin-type N-terminal cleavage/methylation domain-containing protein
MNRKAFTLIELLVVVAIIGILAAVGVVAYNGYTSAAKVTTSKTNYKNILIISNHTPTSARIPMMATTTRSSIR